MKNFIVLLVLLFVFLDVVLATAPADVPSRGEEECRQLGFNKAEVKCQYCQPLLQYVDNKELQKECLSCCTAESQAPKRIYARARIEQRGIFHVVEETSSELGMFYKSFKNKFRGRIRFVEKPSLLWPRLVLEDDKGGEELEMDIAGWTKDTLHDYLVQALGMTA